MHPNSGGNIGQNHILEALTSDCAKSYRDFFFGYFFRDCVDLSSITLISMDLRGLKIPGSVVKDSDFSCSNLGKANLRGSDLSSVVFKATDLTDADLSGATLSDVCFYNANVQGAKFYNFKREDVNTVLDRLKNSCISHESINQKKTILSDQKEIRDFAEKLSWCSGWLRCDKNPPGCPDSIIELESHDPMFE